MKRIFLLLCSILVLLLNLAACNSKPEMPMEITVDGYTIVLGQTTVKDMTDLGYEVKTTKVPDVAKEGDRYIPFYFSLDKDTGNQIFITVLVPWNGMTDVSQEQSLAATEGVIKSVTVSVTSAKNVEVVYNSININDLSFAYAADKWNFVEKEGTSGNSSKLTYTLVAQNGIIELQSATTTDKGYSSINIQLSENAFEKMQK